MINSVLAQKWDRIYTLTRERMNQHKGLTHEAAMKEVLREERPRMIAEQQEAINVLAAESIDFLQGRTSPSVFSRYYLTPDDSLKDQVLQAIGSLRTQLLL